MKDNDVIFTDMWGDVWGTHPIICAKNYKPPHQQVQKEKYGRETFTDCPGIVDYKNLGWLLCAWSDMKIYSDGENVMVYYALSSRTEAQEPVPTSTAATKMSQDIVDGIPENAMKRGKLQPLHITSPWAVTMKNKSLLCLPPTYHSPLCKDFMFYPGIVDYSDKFTTLNIIMSPKTEGEWTIKPGTPLLHLIPVDKQDWNGKYTADQSPKGKSKFTSKFARGKQWYRRYIMKKTRFKMEEL